MYLDFCKVFERAFHERKRERIFLELGIGEVFTSQTGPGSRRDSARSSLPSPFISPHPALISHVASSAERLVRAGSPWLRAPGAHVP